MTTAIEKILNDTETKAANKPEKPYIPLDKRIRELREDLSNVTLRETHSMRLGEFNQVVERARKKREAGIEEAKNNTIKDGIVSLSENFIESVLHLKEKARIDATKNTHRIESLSENFVKNVLDLKKEAEMDAAKKHKIKDRIDSLAESFIKSVLHVENLEERKKAEERVFKYDNELEKLTLHIAVGFFLENIWKLINIATFDEENWGITNQN